MLSCIWVSIVDEMQNVFGIWFREPDGNVFLGVLVSRFTEKSKMHKPL
jgi:hypothetical protein